MIAFPLEEHKSSLTTPALVKLKFCLYHSRQFSLIYRLQTHLPIPASPPERPGLLFSLSRTKENTLREPWPPFLHLEKPSITPLGAPSLNEPRTSGRVQTRTAPAEPAQPGSVCYLQSYRRGENSGQPTSSRGNEVSRESEQPPKSHLGRVGGINETQTCPAAYFQAVCRTTSNKQ